MILYAHEMYLYNIITIIILLSLEAAENKRSR